MATTGQTIDARTETLRALRDGRDLDDVRQLIAHEQLRSRRPSVHVEALLALAVDVYRLTQASHGEPVQMAGPHRDLPARYEFRGKVDNRTLHYALTYPALVHGGLVPDLDRDL